MVKPSERFNMAERTCSVDGCAIKTIARGLCSKHYQRLKHHGTTDTLMRERGAPIPPCTIEGCTNPGTGSGGFGWCYKHYRRFYRHGDPLATSRIVGDDLARFMSYLAEGSPPADAPELGNCWLWTGLLTRDGYGVMASDLPTHSAHRWSYRYHVGPLVEGLELDHLCSVRNCVNPWHLDPVTQAENKKRANDKKRGYPKSA